MTESFNINEIDSIGALSIEDYYQDSIYDFNGKKIPRVTEILSKMIEEDYLLYWANSLGFKGKKYKEVLDFYADLGSRTHKGIEYFLKKLQVPEDTPYFPFTSFINWWEHINSNNKTEIVGQEEKLVGKYFGGTYDFLLKINDKLFLIDFKTSKHVSYKYFIQLAAYSQLLKENKNIFIDGVLILQLSKDTIKFTEYILDFSNKKDKEYFEICERTFSSLVYGYYHIQYLERRFNDEWSRNY